MQLSTAVLSSGMFYKGGDYAPLIETLNSNGWAVTVADFFTNRPKRASVDFYKGRLIQTVERVKTQKVVLIGHSMGGILSLLVNQDLSHRIAGVVCLCSAPPRHIPVYTWDMTWRMRKYFLDFALGRDFSPSYADARYMMFNDVSEDVARKLWEGVTTIPATIASALYRGLELSQPPKGTRLFCVVAEDDHFVRADKGVALANWLEVTPMIVGGGHSLFTGPACSTVCAGVVGWMNGLRYR